MLVATRFRLLPRVWLLSVNDGTIDDDVSIDELREAVEHMHGVPARFVESVEVDERFNGEVVCRAR